MPSPFPGMDPFIEGDLWTSFHSRLANEVVTQLVPKLRPRYVALPEKRYIVVAPGDEEGESRYPDVEVRRTEAGDAATAGAQEHAVPLIMATVMSDPEPHTWVEIREAKRKKLVTAIELLSPANKKGKAREEYLDKRNQYLHSSAHLMEIDLVRQGKRLPMRKPLPSAPYFVFLSRAGQRPRTEVWPIGWEKPLPCVPVPLLNGDPDVILDLQGAFNQVYDNTAFDLNINYGARPDVAPPKDIKIWIDRVLRASKKVAKR